MINSNTACKHNMNQTFDKLTCFFLVGWLLPDRPFIYDHLKINLIKQRKIFLQPSASNLLHEETVKIHLWLGNIYRQVLLPENLNFLFFKMAKQHLTNKPRRLDYKLANITKPISCNKKLHYLFGTKMHH